MTRRFTPYVLTVLTSACYSPELLDGSTESDLTGTSTGTNAPKATDAEGSSTPAATNEASDDSDESGSNNDRPPEIGPLLVNGSKRPSEVTESSVTTLQVDATDDLGVASVVFYDGDEVLGTDTEAPYELEVLLTSSQTGAHVLSAEAVDALDQRSQTEAVSLVVSVTGGEILAMNDDVMTTQEYLGFFGGMVAVSDKRIVVAGVDLDSTEESPSATAVTLDLNLTQINDRAFAAHRVSTPTRYA